MNPKGSRYRSISVEDALKKLRDISTMIARRGGLRSQEDRRVREAFKALGELNKPGNPSSEPRDVYQVFLQKVQSVAGLQMVVLCAVGLGRSVVKHSMKAKVRIDLPFELQAQQSTLESTPLEHIVGAHVTDCNIMKRPISAQS